AGSLLAGVFAFSGMAILFCRTRIGHFPGDERHPGNRSIRPDGSASPCVSRGFYPFAYCDIPGFFTSDGVSTTGSILSYSVPAAAACDPGDKSPGAGSSDTSHLSRGGGGWREPDRGDCTGSVSSEPAASEMRKTGRQGAWSEDEIALLEELWLSDLSRAEI